MYTHIKTPFIILFMGTIASCSSFSRKLNSSNLSFSTSPITSKMSTSAASAKRRKPTVDSDEIVGSTRWVALKTLTYTDAKNVERKWDMAERTTKKSMEKADASVIIPILKSVKSSTLETILIEQYRPPLNGFSVEFPAGLIDEGETPQQAAVRELKEETGYVGTADDSFPSNVLCMSPGLTNEMVSIVVVNVDLDAPENQNPKQELEGGEDITLKRVPLLKMLKSMQDAGQNGLSKEMSMPVAMLYGFAMGVELGLKCSSDGAEKK
uniref:Nudix hydrolase domain-containing protein n=1 Tax=Chaetoceros debilis TaxID=122233 RepID=A0A7S3PVC5_9STRA|mmetsp:Transcript_12373/g.18619  ORF Transcript_12373/g.18619 Transcript_12373/m.18619 type:complete len:267 (+) Transcript_12373:69-869(+)